jgi:galactose mutarotase-like enzyme
MAHYPFPFALEVTYSLKGPKLRVDVRVTNTGTEPMPFGFGLHPYFAVPAEEKPGARVETASLQAYDNLSKRVVSISRVPLTAAEVDMALLGHGSNRSSLRWADDDRVTLEGSKEFKTFVVWSKSDGPFVCLEPWTCGPNALNTGESLLEVPPGETHSLWVTIGATLKQPKPVREYNREEY